MSKSARFESHLNSAVKVFSSINHSIEPQSIKDCFRLGKFSPGSSRPRPILVKFIRISDVTGILTKTSNLSSPYVIKPDMPHEQRVRESALLKERWHLIQSGVHHSNIKIKKDRLFVNNRLHGSVVDNAFQRDADCLPIAMPNLEVSVPPKNVVDSQCIVEVTKSLMVMLLWLQLLFGKLCLRTMPRHVCQIHVLPLCLLLHTPQTLHLNLRSHDSLVLINLSVC